MRNKSLISVLAALLMAAPVYAGPQDRAGAYREGLDLFANGAYDRARTVFESCKGDPLCDGYSLLCALKMRTIDCEELVERYFYAHPLTALNGKIRFEYGRILFDTKRYADALFQFGLMDSSVLNENETAEYVFKCGYSQFALGKYPEALNFFTVSDALPFSEYTATSRYITGVIHYYNREFALAEASFWKASVDPRFTELTDFYIIDCEFNQKNYDYVTREGERVYAASPDVRKERLARIISESYLIKGENKKAKEYYDSLTRTNMTRKDYFYAGTVLFYSDDYAGAIENFNKMTHRSDSLGQLANYQLANAYLRTRNQVAAMGAFYDASNVDFDQKITEDASFNYAKLAFDLNKDTQGFKRYIKRYSTKSRGEQIYGYMALAALYDRDYAAAVEAYDNIDVLSPDMLNNYTKANFLRAEQLFNNDSYRDAVPFFKSTSYYLPKTDRLNQLARYWQAESFYRTGNYPEAEKLFMELFNNDALRDRIEGKILAYNVGYSLFKQKNYGGAARWFDSYISSGDKTYREEALARRADCDFGRHDYKAAVKSYQAVLDENNTADNIYPYYQMAISYGLSGDKKRKEQTLLRVKDASMEAPLFVEAYYELGRAQMDLRKNNDAVATFRHLKECTDDSSVKARALIGMGLVYRNISQYEKALDSYKEVVTIMPDSEFSEQAMLAIESIYQSRKQPEKYMEYLEKNSLSANKTEEEKEQMYFNTAEQLYLAGNYPQTVISAQKYIELYPQGKFLDQALFYMAEAYNGNGEKEKACDAYAKAMKSSSELSFAEVAKLKYASISFGLERYQSAYEGYALLLESAKMEENKTLARQGMMRSAFRGKDYERAISSSDLVAADPASDAALNREASYVKAKSYLATSKRQEAFEIFNRLSGEPATAEGAEAAYLVIQNLCDTGNFDQVEKHVYDFAGKAGEQSYWLAKAYISLGDSFAERSMYSQAKATFESVRDGYSPAAGTKDDVADNVNMRLERLEILIQRSQK